VAADNVEGSIIIEGDAISRYVRSKPVNVMSSHHPASPHHPATPVPHLSTPSMPHHRPRPSRLLPTKLLLQHQHLHHVTLPRQQHASIATESNASWICDRLSPPSAHDSTVTPPTGGAAPSGLVASI